jgi:hypothetical protein
LTRWSAGQTGETLPGWLPPKSVDGANGPKQVKMCLEFMVDLFDWKFTLSPPAIEV